MAQLIRPGVFALRRVVGPPAFRTALHGAPFQKMPFPALAPQSRGCAAAIAAMDGRRKRLLYRAKSRGWLELDVMMGCFALKHLNGLNDDELDIFEEMLELENPDLFKWLTGQIPLPEELKDNRVMQLMVKYVNEDHPASTSPVDGKV
eukprot:gnl/MRDRNA2_/MRDRNA2_100207_c0_seq1.p1 gnl/MRDRNA2_/MRDRNA2_100207_c0~~gnl/MRDRNA2_/MRDRNA2_100207_c0_seq1.p1  ORF type:complete len:170 (+),score=32.74 gnl/MRDRNA2_/MRDRNA2_100207_c0_seq1:68-511(+)